MTKKKYRAMKLALAAALVAASSIAIADDSSIGRFGDSYAYFNSHPVDKSSSTWRQDNPNGVSERRLQSYSGVGEAWHLNRPEFTNVASDSTFRQTHPNGLTERELQALSSPGPAWHSVPAMASSEPSVAQRLFAGRVVRSSE